MGRFASDPGQAKAAFASFVDVLRARVKEGMYEGHERELMTYIGEVCAEYVLDMNEAPPGNQLERLANLILRDELTAMHKPENEYPMSSERQQERRQKKQTKFVEH